jgi:putative restriction endonuclease
LTGVVPERAPGEITLLLGWHEGYEVFVGFDISKHAGQASSSPSIQVRENALLNAHNRSFSVHERGNREVAVAFRAEFLVDYALNQAELHGFSKATEKELEIANEIDSVSESEIQKEVGDPKRREVISTIKQKYRAHDFRARVLAAYSHACAMCGTQLKLVEAAHVLPVAVAGSTDETSNGIALCSLHHSAYDSALVSFDEKYRVEISSMALGGLKEAKLVGGLAEFQSNLKPAIILPADKRDYPDPKYVAQSRKLRNWRG